jgi:hypothetical protein
VPKEIGFKPWSPFLDLDISISMLNLPQEERNKRVWQKKYFQENHIFLEDFNIKKDHNNTLNLNHIEKTNFEIIDKNLFKELISSQYIDEINKTLKESSKSLKIKRFIHQILSFVYFIPKFEALMKKLKIDRYDFNCKEHKAYAAYLTIKPLESLIKESIKHKL